MTTNIETIETAIKTGAARIAKAVKVRDAATESIGVDRLFILLQATTWHELLKIPTGGKGSREAIGEAKVLFSARTGMTEGTAKRYRETARLMRMDKVFGPIAEDPAAMVAECKKAAFKTPKGVEKVGIECFKDMQHYLGSIKVSTEAERIAELAASLGCKDVAEFVAKAQKPAVAKELAKILKGRAAKAKVADAKAKARETAKAAKAKAAPKKAAKKAA